jgi:hypothetical protein
LTLPRMKEMSVAEQRYKAVSAAEELCGANPTAPRNLWIARELDGGPYTTEARSLRRAAE